MSRKIVEDVLGVLDTKELWGAGYRPVLAAAPHSFALGAVLPVVLYMMRRGQRRGIGKFLASFGKPKDRKSATIARVAEQLSTQERLFEGFQGEAEQAVLGDLLLAHCLENINHRTGRHVQLQRVFPTHYFSSWVDLPEDVSQLRGVPELITAILARQEEGELLSKEKSKGAFSIGKDSNLLLQLFSQGTNLQGDSLTSDKFNELSLVGLDQLLTIRIAQQLGEAPAHTKGEKWLKNQLPLAQNATTVFYEDLDVFLRSYGPKLPRRSLLPMLECCLAIGLTHIFTSTLRLMLAWVEDGSVIDKRAQRPWPLFIDCSLSSDARLRRYAEESMDDFLRRLVRMPVIMMCLRILEQQAKQEKLRDLPLAGPDPTERVSFLGDILFDRHEESKGIKNQLRRSCNKLSDALKEATETDNESADALFVLEHQDGHPALRLAEAVVLLMGEKVQFSQFRSYFDSCLLLEQPNGLAKKRKTTLKGKGLERRSIVLTNTALDFLVHRHLRKGKKGSTERELSLSEFIQILKNQYGFYIDVAPPGLSIPVEELRKNRALLERRLRDLGLFVGVNDAESMKRLRARFEAQ